MGYSRGQTIAIAVIFMVLPTSVVGLRIWAKTMSRRGFGWDDYLIVLALATTIGSCVVQLIAAIDGQLGQHQTDAPNGMPILNDPRFLRYETCKFALQMLTYSGYGLAKASILVLYMRIFDVRAFRIRAKILLVVVTAWTISFFFASLFQCYPITPLIEPFYGKKCVNAIPLWYVGSSTDILLDCLILALPIPMVLKLQLPQKQKIGVICMLLLGALATASSVARLVVYVQVGNILAVHFNDETYYTSPVFIWSVIELALGVISACLPTLRPIFLRYKTKPNSQESGVSAYKSFGSFRYGRHPYGRSASRSDDYEIPVLKALEPAVHTHIKGPDAENPELPEVGVIMVHQNIEHV